MKPSWKLAEFFRSGSTERVCQAIYPYIHNIGQESEEHQSARARSLEPIRRKYGHQYLTSFAAARSAQRPGGALDVLFWLDQLQVPLDEMDSAAQTPLFYAAREANLEAIVFLLQHGAKADRRDHNNQTPIFYAAKSEPKQEGTRLECERRRGGRAGLRQEIRKDMDANGRSHKENRLACVEILVEYGADPTHQDELERSASDYARDEDMMIKLEVLCRDWRAGRRAARSRRILPPVDPPCLYLSKLDAGYEGQYMVSYSDPQDVEDLVELENEFIDDHSRILAGAHGGEPPILTVCKSVGVSQKEADRRKIIRSITGWLLRKESVWCSTCNSVCSLPLRLPFSIRMFFSTLFGFRWRAWF